MTNIRYDCESFALKTLREREGLIKCNGHRNPRMRPSATFAEFCAFLINCPHPCVTETGEEEKEMLKRQCCTKTMPVNTELCDRKYLSRNDCYLFIFHRQVHNLYC